MTTHSKSYEGVGLLINDNAAETDCFHSRISNLDQGLGTHIIS